MVRAGLLHWTLAYRHSGRSLTECGRLSDQCYTAVWRNWICHPDPLSGGLPITIGWGSTQDLDGSDFELGDKISHEKADLLLDHQLRTYYLAVLERTIPYWGDMNDNQHGALLSFAYNLGAHFYNGENFQTITRVLKNKEWEKVPDALYLYRNPGTSVEEGLRRRRIAEGDLWES